MNTNRSTRWIVLSVLMFALSAASFAQIGIGISVRIGPPALPVYAQPLCPGPGYMWTPGYWAWNDVGGYYWVPGTWVVAPVGLLWTPGYWGWVGGLYRWHAGYWGPHVGFYGGINYGFGYGGVGFFGGEWRGGSFFYNRSVMNVGGHVTNVYNRTVVVNNNHFAFNGPGGVTARPTAEEERFAGEHHTAPLSSQMEHEHAASQNRQLFASANHGRPAIAATGRAGEFSGHNVMGARAAGEPYRSPQMSPRDARASSNEGRENENRGNEARSEGRANENRASENRNHENARENARSENRSEANHNASRNNEKQSKSEQKQQRQAQKAEHKQAQQAAKQQRQEQKHASKEGHSKGR